METRVLSLSKNGHEFVFRYRDGEEGEIVDELMRLAEDETTDLDWMDAATLGFQVAQNVAIDCCSSVIAPGEDIAEALRRELGSDDAKDGPWSNKNDSNRNQF